MGHFFYYCCYLLLLSYDPKIFREVTDKGVKPKRRVKSEDDGDDDSGKEGKVCEDPSKSAVSKAVSKHGSVIKPAADKKKKVGESARGSKDKGMSFKVSRQDKAATKMVRLL